MLERLPIGTGKDNNTNINNDGNANNNAILTTTMAATMITMSQQQ